MRVFWLIATAFLALIVVIPMAWAEKYYFYKPAGKELPRGQRYDSVRVYGVPKEVADGFLISFLLPRKYSNEKDEINLSFSCGVEPSDQSKYWFFIEDLAVRDDEEKIYSLHYDKGYEEMTPQAKAGVKNYKRKVAVETVNGRIRTKYEVDVYKDETYDKQLTFEASSLPKHLSLDYKFRIRKEGGPAEVFEGTIPMELASYNVGWWEKARR